MALSCHRFTAFAAAVAVFVAQVACLCHTARAHATATEPVEHREPSTSTHACCKHESPATPQTGSQRHRDDDNGRCQHCGRHVPALKPADQTSTSAAAVHFEPVFAADSSTSQISADAYICEGGTAALDLAGLSPPTLLRLHCALNL
jgi:hypothetical protein